jgi:hypothetical protein
MKQKLLRGDKEFIQTLLLLRSYSAEVKEQTIQQALEKGIFVAEEIHDLARKKENQAYKVMEVGKLPVNAREVCVHAPNMKVYDRLTSGVSGLA